MKSFLLLSLCLICLSLQFEVAPYKYQAPYLLPRRVAPYWSGIAVENEKFVKNYRSALSMAVALGAMCVTNFVLDAPLTIFLTNYFKDKFAERHEEKPAQNSTKDISMVSKTGGEHNE